MVEIADKPSEFYKAYQAALSDALSIKRMETYGLPAYASSSTNSSVEVSLANLAKVVDEMAQDIAGKLPTRCFPAFKWWGETITIKVDTGAKTITAYSDSGATTGSTDSPFQFISDALSGMTSVDVDLKVDPSSSNISDGSYVVTTVGAAAGGTANQLTYTSTDATGGGTFGESSYASLELWITKLTP